MKKLKKFKNSKIQNQNYTTKTTQQTVLLTSFTNILLSITTTSGEHWEKALEYWSTLPSDLNAAYDTEIKFSTDEVAPQVTWGTSPEDVLPINGVVPSPSEYMESDPNRAASIARSLEYMGLSAGQRLEETSINKVFIGTYKKNVKK